MMNPDSHPSFEELNDLVDGRLREGDRRHVETHLAGCAECGRQRARLESLLSAAGTLPDDVEPPVELWRDVRDRIATPAVAGRTPRRWQLATAAVVLVALSSGITALLVRPPAVTVRHNEQVPARTVAATEPRTHSVDADYEAAVRELNETLAERRGQLDPATIAKVEASLRVIDLAIDEARHALAADPANLTLHDLLAASYERKLELLRRANELNPST